MMLVSKDLLTPTDANELLRSKLLPQFCKHSESVDLLCKSLLPHVWRVPSSKALSCKHERLFDLLTLASYNIHSHIMMLGSKDLWPPTDVMCAKNTWCGWSSGRFLPQIRSLYHAFYEITLRNFALPLLFSASSQVL